MIFGLQKIILLGYCAKVIHLIALWSDKNLLT